MAAVAAWSWASARCMSGRLCANSEGKPTGTLEGSEGKGIASSNCASRARSEEHTSELQSLMRISYAVFCLKKKVVVSHAIDLQALITNDTTTQQQATDISN